MPRTRGKPSPFDRSDQEHLAVVDGLSEVVLGPRLALDLVVTLDDELMVFLRVDGEVLLELATVGNA